MSMTNRNNAKLDCIIYYTLDELVPQDHLVRKIEEAFDFRFIYPKVQHLYSRHGRPSIDLWFFLKCLSLILCLESILCVRHVRKSKLIWHIAGFLDWASMRRFQTFPHGHRTIFEDIKIQLYSKRFLWKY